MHTRFTLRRTISRSRGFTLLEMTLVIAIIGIIASIAAVAVLAQGSDAKRKATIASMHQIENAITQYHLEKSSYPPSIDALVGRVLQKKPKDGWKREFVYITPAPNGKPYDLYSYGEDGVQGNDDISVWTMDDEPPAGSN